MAPNTNDLLLELPPFPFSFGQSFLISPTSLHSKHARPSVIAVPQLGVVLHLLVGLPFMPQLVQIQHDPLR